MQAQKAEIEKPGMTPPWLLSYSELKLPTHSHLFTFALDVPSAWSSLCPRQDLLHNFWGPVQNENAGLCSKIKSVKIATVEC